ncbi:hypothetical protein [Streptacidiphilus cavernicola]|uniref:Uncharacterized protein n=1 Tax=Streptacidiphilus cavernicola TaxID=3342716 RepID=A0ABV6VNX5_9ACTN
MKRGVLHQPMEPVLFACLAVKSQSGRSPWKCLGRENFLVLQVLQASQGLISADMGGISFQVDGGTIFVCFAVRRRETEELEEDDDIMFELDAFLGGETPLRTRVYVGPRTVIGQDVAIVWFIWPSWKRTGSCAMPGILTAHLLTPVPVVVSMGRSIMPVMADRNLVLRIITTAARESLKPLGLA